LEGKGSFFILIIIVALLTITLAVLAGYLLLGGGGSSDSSSKTTVQIQTQLPMPEDSELTNKILFEDKKYFNLKPTGDAKSVIHLNVQISYKTKVSGIKDVAKKIENYDGEIKEVINTYLQGLTYEDVQQKEIKEKAKEDLMKLLNELLLENEKNAKENKIIYKISFPDWFYQ
jgi:flagellar basal body-associated protein FliL